MSHICKIAIAPNAFKGTLTAMQAADCIARGMRQALPRARFLKIPVADGGDGTAHAIVQATRGRMISHKVHDPLGRPLRAAFGITGDGTTAIIELPLASGLVLLKPHERNPLITSTRGTGELLRAALDLGVQKILIGIGGSATNDAATGIAAALGARFLDARGRPLPDGGGSLIRLAHIDLSALDPRLARIDLEVACDVTNPLFGPRGAAHVYGPQKGATPAMVTGADRREDLVGTELRSRRECHLLPQLRRPVENDGQRRRADLPDVRIDQKAVAIGRDVVAE
jgi:glycerate kinase